MINSTSNIGGSVMTTAARRPAPHHACERETSSNPACQGGSAEQRLRAAQGSDRYGWHEKQKSPREGICIGPGTGGRGRRQSHSALRSPVP